MIYDVADLRIGMENRFGWTDRFCEKWLSEDQSSPADFTVGVTSEALGRERQAAEERGERYSDGYIENICLYREICLRLPRYDRFLLHGAVVGCDGEGYAFLGRSGAGKTTHTGLWLKYFDGTRILNGDKPILSFSDGRMYAHGTPWMGKEGRGEKGKLPLKALCFVEQAKENSIVRLTAGQAAERIFTQLLLPTEEESAAKTLELTDKLVTLTDAWLLRCDVSREAAKISYDALTGKKTKE